MLNERTNERLNPWRHYVDVFKKLRNFYKDVIASTRWAILRILPQVGEMSLFFEMNETKFHHP